MASETDGVDMTVTDLRGPHVVLLATGGTISSRASQAGGGALASDTGDQVVASMVTPASHPVRVVDVFRKGSYLLTVDDMVVICARIKEALADPQVLGVVVSHGTDTMEETAYLVDLTHDDPRPVVFTGAQQAADAESPDGPDNLSRAIAVAGSAEVRGRGVLVVFAGRIFRAAGVRKGHTTRLDAFANPDFGTAGSVSGTGDIRLQDGPSGYDALPLPDGGAGSPRVDLVAVHPGATQPSCGLHSRQGQTGSCFKGREPATPTRKFARWSQRPSLPASSLSPVPGWRPVRWCPYTATAAVRTCAPPALYPPDYSDHPSP
jgi:L-asparaginase